MHCFLSPARPQRCPGCPGRQRGTMTSASGWSSSFSHTDVWSNNNNNSMRLTLHISNVSSPTLFVQNSYTQHRLFFGSHRIIMYPIQIQRVWEARSTILRFSNFEINYKKNKSPIYVSSKKTLNVSSIFLKIL